MGVQISEQNRVSAARIRRAIIVLRNVSPKRPMKEVFEDVHPEAYYGARHDGFPPMVREVWSQILLFIYRYDKRDDNLRKVANLDRFARTCVPEIFVVEELMRNPSLTWDEAAVITSLSQSA